MNNRWHKWRESEKIFIEYLIKSSNIIELIKYFDKIPNTLFKNRKQFYDFIGIELHKLLKKLLFFIVAHTNTHARTLIRTYTRAIQINVIYKLLT